MDRSRKPFVTKKIAAGHMIQRGGESNDAEWLTPGGAWDRSIFEGAAFKKRRDAERVVTTLQKQEEH